MLIRQTFEGSSDAPCALGSKQLAVVTRARLGGQGLHNNTATSGFLNSPGAELPTSTVHDKAPP